MLLNGVNYKDNCIVDSLSLDLVMLLSTFSAKFKQLLIA